MTTAPVPRGRLGRAARDGARARGAPRARSSTSRRRSATLARSRVDAARRAARAAGALGARRPPPLPAPLAGDARDDGDQPLRHLHDEVQPAARRGARGAAGARRAPPVPARGHAPGRPRARSTASTRSCAGSPGWTGSCSRPAAARTPRTHSPASPAPTTRRAGQLARRDEVITTIQAHPCNAATAAAAGFKVVTLMLGPDGYPEVDALRAAVSDRTAALMVNNPDDMGIYNPHIDEWVQIVHDAGGLCFYDHANFNGVMGTDPRARPRLRRVHVHAPQDLRRTQGRRRPGRRRVRLHRGAGALPAGARGRARRRPLPARPRPARKRRQGARVLGQRPAGREGLPVVARHGRRGDQGGRRPLGAREQLHGQADPRDPGDHALERAARRAADGDDALQPRRPAAGDGHRRRRRRRTGSPTTASTDRGSRTSHGSCRSRSRPRPARCGRRRTSTTGSTRSRRSAARHDEDPELVRTAPHNQVVHKLADVPLDDPDYWATTWRAYKRKHAPVAERCERPHRSRHGASKGIGAEVVAALGRAGRARRRALRLRPRRRGGGDRGDPGRAEAARRRRPLRNGRGDACLGGRDGVASRRRAREQRSRDGAGAVRRRRSRNGTTAGSARTGSTSSPRPT